MFAYEEEVKERRGWEEGSEVDESLGGKSEERGAGWWRRRKEELSATVISSERAEEMRR